MKRKHIQVVNSFFIYEDEAWGSLCPLRNRCCSRNIGLCGFKWIQDKHEEQKSVWKQLRSMDLQVYFRNLVIVGLRESSSDSVTRYYIASLLVIIIPFKYRQGHHFIYKVCKYCAGDNISLQLTKSCFTSSILHYANHKGNELMRYQLGR